MQRYRRRLDMVPFLAVVSILFWIAVESGAQVVINEIHYQPAERGPNLEFIELINAGTEIVDLSYWHFEDAVEFTFPPGTSIDPGAVLVVAASPEAFRGHHGIAAFGPWSGKLKNEGETIVLRDGGGRQQDEVDFKAGFPWPTAATGGGASMELIHPALDNALAGSWRSSIPASAGAEQRVFLGAADSNWLYRKGTSEPSRPGTAWRKIGFSPDGSWQTGRTPIGYSDGDDNTLIDDMEDNYSTVYLLNAFDVADGAVPQQILLRVLSDDGAIVWINGSEVARLRAPSGEQDYDAVATRNHEATWEEMVVPAAGNVLKPGRNVIAIQALNGTLDSSDFSIDAEVRTIPASEVALMPTPGAPNFSCLELKSVPPYIGKVRHEPASPKPGDPVTITARVSDPDGLRIVSLQYQVVAPGDYIRADDPRYFGDWETIVMTRASDEGEFTVQVGARTQLHRHLFRYRIVAEDTTGNRVTVPYADDPQKNFAWFCYGGMPGWSGADHPELSAVKTFSPKLTRSMPAIHLLATEEDVINCQYNWSHNEQFLPGTVVFNGTVYDHIRFRNRGETTTYLTGKNKWRINFNRAHELDPALDYAHGTIKPWRRLNLNPGTIPYNPAFRGTSALNERIGFRLHQLAGLPACDTWYAQLRVIDAADEAGDDQYSGDLWGLYLGFEAIDGRFLDNHGLPDGPVYKIAQSGILERRADIDPAGREDFDGFWRGMRMRQPESWWRTHVDMERYFTYHAMSIAVARYDQKLNHNYSLYRHPQRGWLPIPWDLDMCLWPARYDLSSFRWQTQLRYSVLTDASLNREYRNRARELLDLLFTKDQIEALVDELAAPLRQVDGGNFAELDQFLWNYHPRAVPGHRGSYFQNPIRPRESAWPVKYDTNDIAGRIQYFKDYLTDTPTAAGNRAGKAYCGWGYRQLLADCDVPGLPETPEVTLLEALPDKLTFHCSKPGDAASIALHEWRIAKVRLRHGNAPNLYEIEPASEWHTARGEYAGKLILPAWQLEPGQTYRIRSRFTNRDGIAGHWCAPVEIVAPEPDTSPYAALAITEIMYHPAAPDEALRPASAQASDYEFIEIANNGREVIDLTPLQFTSGIDFNFASAHIHTLDAGQRVVVARNAVAFIARYPDTSIRFAGAWGDDRLSDKGEKITLSLGPFTAVHSVEYSDHDGWPKKADGEGYSLEWNGAAGVGWRASQIPGGSPGR